MSIMFAKVNLIVKNKPKTSLSLSHEDRIYVVGFQEKRHAKYVKNVLSTFPRLEMRRERTDNVKDDINKGLLEMGLPAFHDSDVMIDVNADLMINKRADLEPDSDYEIEEVDFAEFIMYPFEKYLGVIMPYDISHENLDKIYFKAHVVEPSTDIRNFTKSLKFD